MGIVKQSARRLAIAAGVIAAVSLTILKPAHAVDTGTAVLTRTTIPTTTRTGTHIRRQPIIPRHLTILRAAAGTRITDVITRAELVTKASDSMKWRA